MNILHVVPTFYPCLAAGGVVNAVYELSKKQAQHGHNVVVFTTDSCDKRIRLKKRYDVDIDGVKTYYFRNLSNSLKSSFLIDTPYSFPFKLRKEIKKYDIIHIHEHRHSLAIATSYYAHKFNIPYVLQAHGSVLPFFQKEKLKEIFDKLWGFKILHNAKKVLALTEVEKQQYLKMRVKEENIEIVPLGINLEEYDKNNLPKKGIFRKKYNIKDDEKLLLFLGRLNKIKGLGLLIKSFSILNDDFKTSENIKDSENIKASKNIKLAIVGPDNGFLKELKTLIEKYDLKKNVIITGPLYENNKKEALLDCDIFIMPSKYESFTTSGLEAMACGKPLVLTENNHISDWVDSVTGFTSEYDEIKLATSIKSLITDEKLMNEFGKNGKNLIKERYNWDSIESQIKTIYENILKK